MAKKAHNAAPWTKKKLNAYRLVKEAERRVSQKADRQTERALARTGRRVDEAMGGCRE